MLDASRYYLILADGVGHGKSSKPSDGLHAHFPQYDYADMVALHHKLLTEGLGVNHLRLIFGTSMGCMHSFVWGETYPDFMDALMPMACLPVQIAGRNRVWRKMLIDGIRTDPEWKNGDYATEPAARHSHRARFSDHRRQRADPDAEERCRRATTPTNFSTNIFTIDARASTRTTSSIR